MKIVSISIYSHHGERRDLNFNKDGLSIITGSSSTGKSALSDIVEYCMGRSTFNVPDGIIRDSVSWFAVLYQFKKHQILIAKPTPEIGKNSCQRTMVRQGSKIKLPLFNELIINSDDDTVISLLSSSIGIKESEIKVPTEQSREKYSINIKHCLYYLFQKQEIIVNKNQLFYRQNEDFQTQAIKDTFPILFGISPDDRYETENRLRILKRDLKLKYKLIEEANDSINTFLEQGISLVSEAKTVGILIGSESSIDQEQLKQLLEKALKWKPKSNQIEDAPDISEIENSILLLRKKRQEEERKLNSARNFSINSLNYSSEAKEQIDRLNSIKALPIDKNTGEWQWPFSKNNLGLETPLGLALLNELKSLQDEMEMVDGNRPKLDKYISELIDSIEKIKLEIIEKEKELSAIIAANEAIKELKSKQNAASKVLGRISYFLESTKPESDFALLEADIKSIQQKIERLENKLGTFNSEEKLASVLNNISKKISEYVNLFGAEFKEYPFRFDLKNVTIVIDRPDRPVAMIRTGGGANHLAYHIATLFAIHYYAAKNNLSMPGFIIIDQPSQVYFPNEAIYKNADGTIQKTEKDADIEAVRKLFQFLYNFTKSEIPNFQIIVTEHANLKDKWFQEALVEPPWQKPPAFVPENWPTQ